MANITDLTMARMAKTEARYLSCAETAKLVRAALKTAFPGIKFSVKSSTYSGGASIDVNWTDGPTSKEVDAIAKRFEGAAFDGMIDLKEYHTSSLNGERVRFGADFVMSQRDLSYDLLLECAERIAEQYGVPAPEVKQSSSTWRGKTHTHAWIVREGTPLDTRFNYDTAGDKALQLAYATSKYTKE